MRSSDPHCVSLGRKRSFQKLESLVQRDPVRAFAHHDLYELDGPAPQKLSYVVLGEVIAHRARFAGTGLIPRLSQRQSGHTTQSRIHPLLMPVQVGRQS